MIYSTAYGRYLSFGQQREEAVVHLLVRTGCFPAPQRPRRRLVAMDSRRGSPPDPTTGPVSALPSVLARVTAFASIFVGAGAGGLIGHSFATLGGFGGVMIGVITCVAMLLGAAGVAVVAVLTLRAFGEWETIRKDHR